jgi:hypothetical protein
MSQEQAWILEEMARSIQAERLAAAEQYRVVTAVPGSYSSPRTVLANALRWLATRVDERPVANPKPEPRLVRAF